MDDPVCISGNDTTCLFCVPPAARVCVRACLTVRTYVRTYHEGAEEKRRATPVLEKRSVPGSGNGGGRTIGRTGTGIGQRGAFGAFLQSAPCRGAPKRESRTDERTDGWTRQEGGGGGGIREGRKAKGARAREESSATRHATLDRRT
ncbi:hypothetical protein ALC56_09072 [Trachymyrmex septentrionalis]|uniref:Uncharacterized protein n=1 Tax=Trachymyrmex septentrionalis TaxID=34720 RepID=A0A151JUY5_9HYME|nr:hypothetical protein ALC56_09072 [Trachymyrmex septentrionalis]